MDSDADDDYASGHRAAAFSISIDSSEVKKSVLEIAMTKSGTNAAKAITAYHERPSLPMLLMLLEEISKNTDFSTDMRIPLDYYMDEFLRQTGNLRVPRRSVIAAAGNVLQYCSKIYGDRVEFMYQAVENQIEALLIADPKKDDKNNTSNNGAKEVTKPEEPRKRRTKKLTQKDFDPFTYNMDVKRFKAMSDDKRFSRAGYEANKNRNRTIEHMYQDHTPAELWKNAPIIDPANPYERDEKKNYKLFTYHPEPRYNTLLPDIPFERLTLIKEYVYTNQMDLSDTLNGNVSNREYLDEYIALENQMLASRYGEVSQKHNPTKESRVQLENLQKRLLEPSEESAKRIKLTENDSEDVEMEESTALQTQVSIDLGLGDTFKNLNLEDSLEDQLDDSKVKAFSSTLVNMEDSNCLDSTRCPDAIVDGITKKEGLQIDSGIDLEDMSDFQHTGQSFDDEGVVLADNIDEQRMQSLSPKVIVRDILPGVPDKANLSVLIDAEMLALSGIPENFEENVNVPRHTRFPIVLNILNLPTKRLRKECIFKLTKDFELFKLKRLPAKRQNEPKPLAVPRALANASPANSVCSLDNIPELPLDQREFDSEMNFRGFRRTTYDSGIEWEEHTQESALLPTDENCHVDVEAEVLPDMSEMNIDVPQVRDGGLGKVDPEQSMHEIPMDTLNETAELETERNTSDLNETPLGEAITHDMNGVAAMQGDKTEADLEACEIDLDTDIGDDLLDEEALNNSKNSYSIDEETDAKIIDWHRRLGPTLEAAHARQNFSIQHLNDEIIKKCQEKNGQATLADVVEDKDPTKLCCYMLSSLLLTNQGNVALKIDKHDKSKPLEMHQVTMNLLSTERKQLNPEDEIGNIKSSINEKQKPTPTTSKAIRRKAPFPDDDNILPVNEKTVRLIAPMPKASARPDDADSGISSLTASVIY